MTTGARVYGVLVSDRETGKAYALHNACHDVLCQVLGEAGVSPSSRLVPMGPASTDPTDTCDLASCGMRLSEDVTR
jgi:hypothetical protein